MILTRAATLAVSLAVLLSACGDAVTSDPAQTEVLRGAVVALLETGEATVPPFASVTVRNAQGDSTEIPAAPDGSWSATGLTQGPYTVRATVPGFASLTVEGIEGGTEDVPTRVVRRSTARVLGADAIYRDENDCGGDAGCMDVSFRAVGEGLFTSTIRRRVFRIFIGNSPDVSPENHQEEVVVLVTEDDPLLESNGDDVTLRVENIYGFNYETLRTSDMFIYVVGATENSVVGPLAEDMAELDFPDLAASGASVQVQR